MKKKLSYKEHNHTKTVIIIIRPQSFKDHNISATKEEEEEEKETIKQRP